VLYSNFKSIVSKIQIYLNLKTLFLLTCFLRMVLILKKWNLFERVYPFTK